MIIDKDYNPFKHLHSRLDIIEMQLVKITKHLEMPQRPMKLTRKMIKEEFNISYGTIHNHMNSGELKYFKVGASTRFHRKDVEEWIKRIV